MENEMIERVARAIVEDLGKQDGYDDPKWINTDGTIDWLDQGEVNMYAVARAAIEAMREPTEEMQAAGQAAGGKAYEWTGDSLVFHASNSWPAMIDAALDRQPPSTHRE